MIGMPAKTWDKDVMESILGQGDKLLKVLVPEDKIQELSRVSNEDHCYYFVYPSKSGAQLWGVVDRENGINKMGVFEPHFHGESRIKMSILCKLEQPWENDDGTTSKNIVLDGALMGFPDERGNAMNFLSKYIENKEEVYDGSPAVSMYKGVAKTTQGIVFAGYSFMDPVTREGFYGFYFDCRNFGFLHRSRLPTAITVQLSAFAHEIRTYDSVENYYETILENDDGMFEWNRPEFNDNESLNKTDHVMFLASQFLGTGDFARQFDDEEGKVEDFSESSTYERCCACMIGHVLKVQLMTNEFTGHSFYWALIETASGMQIDVVIHPHLLEAYQMKPPVVGGVISGKFWLSGLLKPDNL